MPENIPCVYCKAPLRLPEQFIGQEVRCPSCQRTFTARMPVEPPPPRPEPREEEPLPRPPRDEAPRRRRPRDDDDEDYPRRRRPRYDEDEPRRVYALGDRSGVVLALGIVSVVFIFLSCIV